MLTNMLSLARKLKRSDTFKSLAATRKRRLILAQQRGNGGIFAIEIEAKSGFFAIMQMILFILVYCEKNGLWPAIGAKGGIYGEESAKIDWFKSLFDTVRAPEPSIAARLATRTTVRTSKIRDVSELGFRSLFEMQLTLAKASALFNGHYRPAGPVLAEVDAIAAALGISLSTLAVHYRGTDKVHEAGLFPWRAMCEAVERIAADRATFTEILLASDDAGFIEFFHQQDFSLPVRVAPAAYMPKGSTPIHFSGHPGLAIGKEALITCLLLARCGFLIKTSSYLSGWAKIFNPSLPVWLVSPQIGAGFFPDRALWNDQVDGKVSFARLS